jgi:hypothetical protein
MNNLNLPLPGLRNGPGIGLLIFGLLLAMIVLGWIVWPGSFFPAYWFGLMFWVQLSIGCLILLLVQLLTGGKWGEASAPLLRRGAAGLFILLPLFLPVFFALPHIFSWTNIEAGISSEQLVRKQIWLNPAAFITRAIVFLAILAALIQRWRRPGLTVKTPGSGWSGPALVFVILVLSLASCDWMMSIEPSFYSSLYPFMYFAGAMVSTLALMCGAFSWLQMRRICPRQPELLGALGQLFFASVLFWGYIVFSQFIIIWTGNLPDEADWYVVRSHHGWQWLTLFVITFHFAVPFCLLLSRKLKRDPRRLLWISCALFLVHFAEVYWMMAPERGVPFYLNPFDFLMPILIGACWLWFTLGLREKPMLASLTAEEAS